MTWQEFIKDYLTFTRKERIAILVILFIILVIVILPKIINPHSKSFPTTSDSGWANTIRKLERKENKKPVDQAYENDYAYQYDPPTRQTKNQNPDLFYFDPNNLSFDGWRKLGLKEKNVQTILNYRTKGGHFYKAEDLKKIYGLRKEDYERIAPYIRISQPKDTENKAASSTTSKPETTFSEPKNFRQYSVIDINSADTTAFISLPGIGSRLAARIVLFREKLGGFYSVDQLAETFGLPDSTFQKIKQYLEVKNLALRKININTASLDELKVHPYIKWSIANPLIAFRNEHGFFSSIEDIKKIPSVTEGIFNKIAPYLIIQ